MKLFHFSDTHLGFSEYHRLDPETGINQREQDFYLAWWQAVDAILQIRPDVVIHAGDLFHTPRPSNRAIRIALEGIQKISDAGIPLVLISGNHSTPRIRTTGSIFESIALFPNVFGAYSSRYERFRIQNADFHCVPHCSQSEELENAFQSITLQADAQYNVLVCHGAWTSQKSYSMGEFSEQRLPDVEQKHGLSFDYVALGHYHRRIDVKEHVCYSGATERTSLNEANNSCGYLLIDLATKTKDYVEIKSRPMIRLAELDCRDLVVSQIYEHLQGLSTSALAEAIVSIRLVNISHETFVQLDAREIEQIFSQVYHLEKRFEQLHSEGTATLTDVRIDALPIEFERYVDSIPLNSLDATRLKNLGTQYLTETT